MAESGDLISYFWTSRWLQKFESKRSPFDHDKFFGKYSCFYIKSPLPRTATQMCEASEVLRPNAHQRFLENLQIPYVHT